MAMRLSRSKPVDSDREAKCRESFKAKCNPCSDEPRSEEHSLRSEATFDVGMRLRLSDPDLKRRFRWAIAIMIERNPSLCKWTVQWSDVDKHRESFHSTSVAVGFAIAPLFLFFYS